MSLLTLGIVVEVKAMSERRGGIIDRAGRPTVLVDAALGGSQREWVLAHEAHLLIGPAMRRYVGIASEIEEQLCDEFADLAAGVRSGLR